MVAEADGVTVTVQVPPVVAEALNICNASVVLVTLEPDTAV